MLGLDWGGGELDERVNVNQINYWKSSTVGD
jgi:hypothetical protein